MDLIAVAAALQKMPANISSFIKVILDLLKHLVYLHGVYRGTYEAVIVEAQGGVFFDKDGSIYDHATSLANDVRAITKQQDKLQGAIRSFNRISPQLGSKLESVTQPLTNRAQEVRNLAQRTQALAQNLSQTAPTRLQGVKFGSGGLGASSVRDTASLASSQLQAQAVQLRDRGIDPRLVANAEATTEDLLYRIGQQPVNKQEAAKGVLSIVAAMRLAINNIVRSSSLAFAKTMSFVLDGLIVGLEEFVTATSGILFGPALFIINPDRILREIISPSSVDA